MEIYQESVITSPNKYETIREQIRKIFTESLGNYGYCRIYMVFRRWRLTGKIFLVDKM